MTPSSTIPAGFEDLRGRAFQERYAIAELVGAAAHRVAFAGEGEGGRPIVLVVVRPTATHDAATLARFERRVRACARVRHPAVGGPIDSGETLDGKLWLVFERPEGEPLERALARSASGRLAWAEARPLLLELVRGLGAAHARGVVHGGVSPACCWVHGVGSDAPALRLLDWGANADPAGDEVETSGSRTTTLGGDPVFMAPESAGGVLGDERSDAYLVGLVAWVMLVGRPPFQAANAFQLVSMHLQAPVPAMKDAGADVPAAVEAWVRGLLAKERELRPASMTEVEQGILGIDELGNRRQVRPEELDKPRGRRGRAKAASVAPSSVVASPSAVLPPSAAPPSAVAAPVPPPSAGADDELAGTLMFEGNGAVARPAAPASDDPGTMMLTAPRGAAAAGGLPDATVRLGAEVVVPSDMPDATLMLSGVELVGGGALQPATMVLGAEPRRGGAEAQDPAATVALTANATMLARGPEVGPGHAPTTLLAGEAAPGGPAQGSTMVLGAGSPGFEPREPAPVPQGMHAPPVSAPHPQASASYAPPTGAPAPAPARSGVGTLVVILIVIAAVAGVAVGLLLAGG